jgi:hypothetical protein
VDNITAEFLEDNQICEWAEERGLVRHERFKVQLPDLPSTYRAVYANGRRSGRESAMASELAAGRGSWDECLVWITGWGVWPSGEDWPQFYAWRGALGERRSVEAAPGLMENAWEAEVICSVHGRADRVRGRISHDQWYELLGSSTDRHE